MKPSEIIREGMKHVEAGWHKGKLEDPLTGAVCAQGGLRKAAFGGARVVNTNDFPATQISFIQALQTLNDYAMEHDFTSHMDLNDYGSYGLYPTVNKEFGRTPTTAQDVLIMMEKAAIAQEEIGQ